ncbi:MAG: GIY-YIG nuclease family protein [Solobacterium sp.]|nr:GIY-YIG nuclease family protein [Solobacterium sp.]
MKYYVYILECADGTFYTGYSTDPQKRLKMHNAGKGAKYTRSRCPCSLVYTAVFDNKSAALSREWHIKHKFSHDKKEKLVNENK